MNSSALRAMFRVNPIVTSLTRVTAGSQQIRTMRLYRERTVRLMYWRGRSFDAIKLSDHKREDRLDWNYRSEIYAFSRRLQENISEDTLRQIFAHQSYVDKMKRSQLKFNLPEIDLRSNVSFIQRGEELLDQCIKPYLRYNLRLVPEDGVSSITNYLKSEPVLADVAKWIGCKDIILCSESPPSPTTMADTVRAVIAGIEQDLSFARAQRFVVDMIISYLNDKDILDDVWIIPNPKETLNHLLNNSQLPPYEPRIMFQTGVKTLESCHIVGLYVNQKLIGSSAGETIEIAEESAATNSLKKLFELEETMPPFIYGEASDSIDYKAHSKGHDCIKTWRFALA